MNNMRDLRREVAVSLKDEFDGFLVEKDVDNIDILDKADVYLPDEWWREYYRADGTMINTEEQKRQEKILATRLLHRDGHIVITSPYEDYDVDEYVYVEVEVPDEESYERTTHLDRNNLHDT
ncbi:MAG: hypothetical protein J07AB43_00800 [Candidatus Nanosalina sp. J07AB43]|nr:MAG: hypothetical protein J07AB43_00800 [Candidatus Nanosalina sp. J07AB43]